MSESGGQRHPVLLLHALVYYGCCYVRILDGGNVEAGGSCRREGLRMGGGKEASMRFSSVFHVAETVPIILFIRCNGTTDARQL